MKKNLAFLLSLSLILPLSLMPGRTVVSSSSSGDLTQSVRAPGTTASYTASSGLHPAMPDPKKLGAPVIKGYPTPPGIFQGKVTGTLIPGTVVKGVTSCPYGPLQSFKVLSNPIADKNGFLYFAAWNQVTKINQDAYIIKTDSKRHKCWVNKVANTVNDERCTVASINTEGNKQFLYFLCSVDGGDYGTTFKGGPGATFQQTYGRGGTSGRVGYILKTDMDGVQVAGTYLVAMLRPDSKDKNGKLSPRTSNSLNLTAITPMKDKIMVQGTTAYGGPYTTKPIKSMAEGNFLRCKSGSPYKAYFSLDLSTLLSSECQLDPVQYSATTKK